MSLIYVLRACCGKIESTKLEKAEDEKLIPYSQAMPDSERRELLKVEEHFSKRYGIRTLSETTLERLESADDFKSDKGKIEDEPSYRIDQIEDY